MVSPITIIGIISVLVAVAIIVGLGVFSKPTGTYETVIIDKREQDTVIYTGIFIPMKLYILETTELHQLQVKKQVYEAINVGDRVTVTRYSNGQHKLQG